MWMHCASCRVSSAMNDLNRISLPLVGSMAAATDFEPARYRAASTQFLARGRNLRKEPEMKKFVMVVIFFVAFGPLVRADATFSLAPVGGIVMASDQKVMIVSVPSEGKLIYYDTLAEKELRQV